ncbi:response regulator [Hymenobacter cheonanensis]|uniref:response regulator n=1 Tax=Hymenobacter sp. CA2-7 TaxID=3063993 RepID=UPI002712ACA2|nr:response regulator [Hymenobacter sp. CA2-7]MDO7884585.1 response regulator [Hymenobacter sp. CA2-7]
MPKLSSVLLVDDDTTTNFLNELLLKRLQLTDHLLVAHNGAEALALLGERAQAPEAPAPALILLDINMPVMDGLEFLEAFQQLPPARQQASTIVMLTTSLDGRDLARMQALPIAGLVSKPLTAEKLQTILQLHFPE